MKLQSLFVAVSFALAAPWACAQWQWLDSSGHKVFSDRPPSADVPEKNILRRPGNVPRPAAPATEEASPATPAGAGAAKATKPSALDKEVEERRKKAEAAEADKKKADEAKQAAQRAENCSRARQALATLESGMRIAQINEQGERVIMDDAGRAAETQRIQAIINSDCR